MWSILGQFITWILVVWGWAVVSELQDFRELRKDRLARLGDLRQLISDAEASALEFHTSKFDGQKALKVQSTLGAIGRELTFLNSCGYIGAGYSDVLIDLRQACTEANFDRTSHKVVAHDDSICLVIMGVRAQLDAFLIDSQTDAAKRESNPGRIVRRHIRQAGAYVRMKFVQRSERKSDEDY